MKKSVTPRTCQTIWAWLYINWDYQKVRVPPYRLFLAGFHDKCQLYMVNIFNLDDSIYLANNSFEKILLRCCPSQQRYGNFHFFFFWTLPLFKIQNNGFIPLAILIISCKQKSIFSMSLDVLKVIRIDSRYRYYSHSLNPQLSCTNKHN